MIIEHAFWSSTERASSGRGTLLYVLSCGYGSGCSSNSCAEDDTLEKKLELLHNEIEHERELQHKRSTIGRRGWERLKAAYVVRCMGTGV